MDRLASLAEWEGAEMPQRETLEGRYVRLEPLDADLHSSGLWDASSAPGAAERFRFLPEAPPAERGDFDAWIGPASESRDPLFFAVVDRQTETAEGRASLMRIDPANGVIEIGHVMWGPRLARTRGATEALFLLADHVFGLGYRRLEWKCDARNLPSRAAAERFGFLHEGTFRQHMVVKGLNRDTAWFALLHAEWAQARTALTDWLRPENFDADGVQRARLGARSG